MTTNYESITFLGWTDEVNDCDLCGKADLKSTAALEIDGETVYYGCVCAARALSGRFGQKISAAKIRRETETAHTEQVRMGEALDRGIYREEHERACAWRKDLYATGQGKIAGQIGINAYGEYIISRKIGRGQFERFVSADSVAVYAKLHAWSVERCAA